MLEGVVQTLAQPNESLPSTEKALAKNFNAAF